MSDSPLQEDVKTGNFHTHQLEVYTCTDGTKIKISYPGIKTKILGHVILRYDYKVTMTTQSYTTALSHCNIIVDIFQKIKFGKMSSAQLLKALFESMLDKKFYFSNVQDTLQYSPIAPKSDLLQAVQIAHGDKKFNLKGNEIDLPLDVLFQSLKWIAIQEDINYPISQNLQGRRLSLSRYIEAIKVASGELQYNIEDVVKRTLSHSIPKQWAEIDYTVLQKVK